MWARAESKTRRRPDRPLHRFRPRWLYPTTGRNDAVSCDTASVASLCRRLNSATTGTATTIETIASGGASASWRASRQTGPLEDFRGADAPRLFFHFAAAIVELEHP
jgi:hypothetical protein